MLTFSNPGIISALTVVHCLAVSLVTSVNTSRQCFNVLRGRRKLFFAYSRYGSSRYVSKQTLTRAPTVAVYMSNRRYDTFDIIKSA